MNLFLFEEVTEKTDLKSYNTNILTNSITFNPHIPPYLPVNTYLAPILMYIWIIIYLIYLMNAFLSNIYNT